MEKTYIAYYRVSTKKQEAFGFGLDAQREIAHTFVANKGRIIEEFTEIESGKNNNRVELNKAIEASKAKGAILLVAKLDRLSRNVQFLFSIRDANIDFQCCDVPDLNTVMLGILGAIAQQERELISSRTKAALSVKKANGDKLGNPNWRAVLTHEVQQKGAKANQLKALNHPANKQATALAVVLKQNKKTLSEIAQELNKNGFKTPEGCLWIPSSVSRLLRRYQNSVGI